MLDADLRPTQTVQASRCCPSLFFLLLISVKFKVSVTPSAGKVLRWRKPKGPTQLCKVQRRKDRSRNGSGIHSISKNLAKLKRVLWCGQIPQSTEEIPNATKLTAMRRTRRPQPLEGDLEYVPVTSSTPATVSIHLINPFATNRRKD